ncbi:ATP-dependent Clp protease proteolytic subunit [Actinotalea sp. M2MS4P-6]|uniref:ClpP family protease n=1 Tax=Actinotalea sp. M2MS4P-6 TaxID=2983762 RepID=UPI0021E4D493|nr:ATP-dependent Clp protease proteolytic subunit [Actinotalea sp. M2MS4P-6]MCV2393014.1 ATP-dependent Clp protease proteolytic subunit [Actinotalea sp. M2MS4P-6]
MSGYAIPYVTERRPGGGERVTDVFSWLLSERIVYVGAEIDDGLANVLVAQLLHLQSVSDAPIDVYVNSPGGSTSAMLAVYDAMQFVAPEVTTTCVGQAAGPAAVLLAGGAAGRRGVLPHARVLLHQPSAQGRGTIPDLILAADEVVRVRGELEQVLARHTGKDVATLRRDTDRDLVLDAEQAVAYGVADAVVPPRRLPVARLGA